MDPKKKIQMAHKNAQFRATSACVQQEGIARCQQRCRHCRLGRELGFQNSSHGTPALGKTTTSLRPVLMGFASVQFPWDIMRVSLSGFSLKFRVSSPFRMHQARAFTYLFRVCATSCVFDPDTYQSAELCVSPPPGPAPCNGIQWYPMVYIIGHHWSSLYIIPYYTNKMRWPKILKRLLEQTSQGPVPRCLVGCLRIAELGGSSAARCC